jgi:hypothetical protein
VFVGLVKGEGKGLKCISLDEGVLGVGACWGLAGVWVRE